MDAGASVETETVDFLADRRRAAHRAGGPVECREQSVTRSVHESTSETRYELAGEYVVCVEQLSPAAVTQLRDHPGRGHQIGEHDGGQNPVVISEAICRRTEIASDSESAISACCAGSSWRAVMIGLGSRSPM